jgi:pimeloyl-ACP methyl ester carboxylesterase
LGATVAALFPDRIDRVILDGVMNSHEYYHLSGEPQMLQATDATFEAFLDACFESAEKCPLARMYENVDDLKDALAELFDDLRYSPIPAFPAGSFPQVLDYSLVNSMIVSTLYRPPHYQNLSIALAGLLEGDSAPWAEVFFSPTSVTVPRQAEAILGIRCGDKIPRASSLEELEPIEEQFHETSKWFPGFGRGWYVYACAQWPFEAKERYEGDFNVKTKNPILFIGNTYDPVTPLKSAQNMSAGFEGSVVLHHNGFGHLSFTQPSNCTNEYILNFFANGDLPEPGTVCEPNDPLFANDPEI